MCPPPSFGISFNPIRTKGADYARHITTGPPPIFLDDAASLLYVHGVIPMEVWASLINVKYQHDNQNCFSNIRSFT